MVQAMQALKREGARPEFWIAATHGVFTEGACEKLSDRAVREVLVTDSIPVRSCGGMKLQVVKSAPLFASALLRLVSGQSMGQLFE